MGAYISPRADIHSTAKVDGVTVWDHSQVREHAAIGSGTNVGRGVYVGPGVLIGENCKIQNSALIYEPAILENGVFIGPSVVLTNDQNPRAVLPSGVLKSASDWIPVGVHVDEGASIGASAVCIAPLTIGRWAMIAAGSVVSQDVPDFALVKGVPARFSGWVGKAGFKLAQVSSDLWICPKTGELYQEIDGSLSPLETVGELE